MEQRSAKELTRVCGIKFTDEDFEVTNPAFDITPADLIDAIITEKGIARYPYNAFRKST